MTKTANLYARIEPNLKTEAEGILANLGIPVSNAINIFYRQIVIHRGLPFEVKLVHSISRISWYQSPSKSSRWRGEDFPL